MKVWIRSLRIPQWAKNLLVFVPLLMAHAWDDAESVTACWIAFAAMCLCASGTYLVNDLLDLPFDRRHPHKRLRPLASGALSPAAAVVTALVFTAAALGIAYAMSPGLLAAIGAYIALTLLYSLWLRSKAMIDVIVLAGLYTTRLFVGAVAIDVALSFWLLAFSVFIFLSLALVKRYSELLALRDADPGEHRGRGYRPEDLDTLLALGTASGFMSVLVLALYIDSEKVRTLYAHPEVIWLLCPVLLYWLGRVWLLTRRGEMHHDPVTFALTDAVSLCVALLAAAALAFAL